MPTPEQILQGLAYATNHYSFLSILWHFAIYAFLILLLSGKRPSRKTTGLGLSLMIFSVGIIAIITSNPFNAAVFIAAAIFLGIVALKFSGQNVEVNMNPYTWIGIIMVIFGTVYPHFLENSNIVQYFFKAPTGLIPCPTLSLVIGFTLLFRGFESKKWMISLAILGLFYGLFGVFRLKVHLDIFLIAGTLVLLTFTFSRLASDKKIVHQK